MPFEKRIDAVQRRKDDGCKDEEGPFMVGEYVADYGPLPSPEELDSPEVDELIAGGRVISVLRL